MKKYVLMVCLTQCLAVPAVFAKPNQPMRISQNPGALTFVVHQLLQMAGDHAEDPKDSYMDLRAGDHVITNEEKLRAGDHTNSNEEKLRAATELDNIGTLAEQIAMARAQGITNVQILDELVTSGHLQDSTATLLKAMLEVN